MVMCAVLPKARWVLRIVGLYGVRVAGRQYGGRGTLGVPVREGAVEGPAR
jgi:hypothetical protein